VGVDDVRSRQRKAVFLDRDGVLNDVIVREGKPYPPTTVDELQIDEETAKELYRLVKEGFILIGITNQPDVARGTQRREIVESINDAIRGVLPLRELRVCYHDDRDHCRCRKPEPGLLLDASAEHDIDLSSSYVIGDRWKDVEAGKRAGCHSIWIDRGYAEKRPDREDAVFVNSLKEAIDHIISHTRTE
jgi:D-glycero-D-manno-heptose 1,7-bisphosphate phosphatase